ncbi:GPR1/FUN34/yaaH family [Rhizoctonia solani]|uniref:GPR1/FUN34/yaaH family n=1 Tax=Rhizoctonia solani TaxID=456999 RepID=A0A8H7M811_9AGAM|nr:GPR1/FUN34/yaaH family [Rhizoctonia solani]
MSHTIENLKNTFVWKKPEPVDCDAEAGPSSGSPVARTINDDDRTRIEEQERAAPAAAPITRTETRDTHPAFPIEHRKFGNPAPLGLFGFAATTLMLGLYYVNVRDITVPNMVVGMAFCFGGLAQLLAGMWEFGVGNTFGATVFSSYGGFWIAYAIILFPPSGILEAFSGDKADDLSDALGIFLMVWFIVSLIFFFGTFKASIVMSTLLVFVCMGYLLLMIGQFRDQISVLKAGGVFCCLAAFTASTLVPLNYMPLLERKSTTISYVSTITYRFSTSYCLLPVGNLKETSVHGLCTKGSKKNQSA